VAVADLPLHYMINNNDIYKGHRSFVVDVLFSTKVDFQLKLSCKLRNILCLKNEKIEVEFK